MKKYLPAAVGVVLAVALERLTGWWGYLVLFPWVGLCISFGLRLQAASRRPVRPGSPGIGRRTAILLILPALLFFEPLAHRENLQLEGAVLLLTAGIFTKGVVHWALAHVLGPLAWGRGFCGWACWYAAALDWLPMKQGRPKRVGKRLGMLRWSVAAASATVALVAVYGLGLDVRGEYFGRQEVAWMFASVAFYYLAAIPLAYAFGDRRAFCKVLCPAAAIMKIPARASLLRVRPAGRECSGCGMCSRVCPMDVDVRRAMLSGKPVLDTECILCGDCVAACPTKAIR